MAIVDDHSRLVVGARLFFADDAYNFQKLFKDTIATYGICQKLYVDHGPSYQNSQLPFICGSIGTVLIHAPVRDGAAKAKVERFFGVLKRRWVDGLNTGQFYSIDDFNYELNEAVRIHNLTENSSIKQTPIQRFLDSKGKIKEPKSEEWLTECFMNRISRKVKNDSTISMFKTQFDAPMQFIGQTVDVRFLPDRLDEAYIYDNGKHFPLKVTDKHANSKVKRLDLPTVDYSKGVASSV
jgi:hypothetical protein